MFGYAFGFVSEKTRPKTMPTPFFSTLTEFRRKMYTQFEPLIIHQKKPQLIAITRVAVFLYLKTAKKPLHSVTLIFTLFFTNQED